MYRTFLGCRKHKLSYYLLRGYLHNHRFGGFAVLNKHHVGLANRLDGVNLCTCRSIVLPNGLVIFGNLSYTILVGNQDVSISHKYSIAYLATALCVFECPIQLTIFQNKHSHALALSCIEEIVLSQTHIGTKIEAGL